MTLTISREWIASAGTVARNDGEYLACCLLKNNNLGVARMDVIIDSCGVTVAAHYRSGRKVKCKRACIDIGGKIATLFDNRYSDADNRKLGELAIKLLVSCGSSIEAEAKIYETIEKIRHTTEALNKGLSQAMQTMRDMEQLDRIPTPVLVEELKARKVFEAKEIPACCSYSPQDDIWGPATVFILPF